MPAEPGPPPDPAARRAFLDERRRSHERRMDAIHAPTYDEHWGEISPSHASFVGRFLDLVRPSGLVLDAPCGTGKYWPAVLASGRTLVGIDQSAGMLEVARRKHPAVPASKVGLQDMTFDSAFDGVMCVDALENVGPEDWPLVLERLVAAARPGAPLYLTVELPEEDALRREQEWARSNGHPVLPGEMFDGVGYHYYPEAAQVAEWLAAAGLELVEHADGDEYAHYLARRPAGSVAAARALPTVTGDRVILRPLASGDREPLARILAEPEVGGWWVTTTIEETLDELYSEPAVFAIEFEGGVIGAIEYDEEDAEDYRHAGIDVFVGAAHQNRGLGTDAVRTLARYLVRVRGHHRLTIDPAASNERAIRAYTKVGFRPVGVMRRYERGADGAWHDGLLMDLLAGELTGDLTGEP